jgi:hypothetical protein
LEELTVSIIRIEDMSFPTYQIEASSKESLAEDGVNMFLRNVGELPHNVALHRRR